MICAGCHQESHHIQGCIDERGQYQEVCAGCGNLASIGASVPDVFWNGRPYYSQALDVEFTSRSQKARIMKERGVSELGSQKTGQKSWIDGTRAYRRKQFEKDRPKIRQIYKEWKEKSRAQ